MLSVTRDVLEAIHQRRSGPNPGSDLFATVDSFRITPAEIAAGVTPVNYAYAPGNAWRYMTSAQITDVQSGSPTLDCTAALQNWINVVKGGSVIGYLPAGTYLASNLTWYGGIYEGDPRQSVIKAMNSGDNGYLAAHSTWLANNASSVDAPCYIAGIDFNGANFKTNAFVFRSFYAKIENCFVYAGNVTDFLISADTRSGLGLTSSMVNSYFERCWFGGDGGVGASTQYNFNMVDTNGKCTDCHLIDNFLSGASANNAVLTTSAGWTIANNHTYGPTVGVAIKRPSIGTSIVNNYFENWLQILNMIAGYDAILVGPGNQFLAGLIADFGSFDTYNQIVSMGNWYGPTAALRHDAFDPSKWLISQDDIFEAAQPVQFYSAGTPQPNSTGKVRLQNALVSPINRTLTAVCTGASVSGGPLPVPASWDSDNYQTPGTLTRDNYNGYYPRLSKLATAQAITNSAFSINVDMPDLVNDATSYKVEISVLQKLNYNSTLRTAYYGVWHVVFHTGGVYGIDRAFESITPAQWTSAPAVTQTHTGGVMTINIAGTPSTTDGLGTVHVSVSQ